MSENKSVKHYAELAYEILNSNTGYNTNKKIISSFFEDKHVVLTTDIIITRLTIIDAMYSTNMSKRLFGISDLALKIFEISKDGCGCHRDSHLIKKIDSFILRPEQSGEINKILNDTFGIDKTGKMGGVAISLISKYFYFLMGCKFPIYDSLVKDYLPKISNNTPNIKNITNLNSKNRIAFFEKIITFNKESGINDFEELDNLCWLFGKVSKGSYSLILEKENYKNLVDHALS